MRFLSERLKPATFCSAASVFLYLQELPEAGAQVQVAAFMHHPLRLAATRPAASSPASLRLTSSFPPPCKNR